MSVIPFLRSVIRLIPLTASRVLVRMLVFIRFIGDSIFFSQSLIECKGVYSCESVSLPSSRNSFNVSFMQSRACKCISLHLFHSVILNLLAEFN